MRHTSNNLFSTSIGAVLACAGLATSAGASSVSLDTSRATPIRDSTPRDTLARQDTAAHTRADSATPECAHAKSAWLFCDDFETDRLSQYFEYTNPHGSFIRVQGAGVGGSWGMRAHFDARQQDAGSLKLAFGKTPDPYIRPVDQGTAVYRELYWRVYVRNDPYWTGGGGDKLSRAQSLVSSSWAQAMVAPVWSGSNPATSHYLFIDPASGTDPSGNLLETQYNDFAHQKYLGYRQGIVPLFDAAHVGRWYCVETHVRLNDPGQSNGVFELWIDGQPQASRADLNWLGSYSAYGVNAVFFENYWNAGSPRAQNRYLDNIVVSTARIGC